MPREIDDIDVDEVLDDDGVAEESDLEDAADFDDSGDPALELFDRSQRDIVTSVVDYNLGTLADLVRREKIDLSPKYQRRFRWDAKRQSKLIESFLMNVPIPPIFLSEDQWGKYAVIDGKQRLFAIRHFLGNGLALKGLKVFDDINGETFDALPPRLRDILETRATLRAIIILPQSQPAIKFEVFQRLNTGGVRLNAQEIRNSSFPGPLNDLILDLSASDEFHKILGIKEKNRSAIYRQMRDAEFVLRYFTFRNTWDSFGGGVKRLMDTFMEDNQRMKRSKLSEAEEDFRSTLSSVRAGFGEHAFRRWVPEEKAWRSQVLASLFDAQMFAMRGRDEGLVRKKRKAIDSRNRKLFSDSEFRNAIDAATNTPRLLKTRIRMMNEVLDDALT